MKLKEKWLKTEFEKAKKEMQQLRMTLANAQQVQRNCEIKILGLGGRLATLQELLDLSKEEKKDAQKE